MKLWFCTINVLPCWWRCLTGYGDECLSCFHAEQTRLEWKKKMESFILSEVAVRYKACWKESVILKEEWTVDQLPWVWYLHVFWHLLMHSASVSNLLALPPHPPYQIWVQILFVLSKNHLTSFSLHWVPMSRSSSQGSVKVEFQRVSRVTRWTNGHWAYPKADHGPFVPLIFKWELKNADLWNFSLIKLFKELSVTNINCILLSAFTEIYYNLQSSKTWPWLYFQAK